MITIKEELIHGSKLRRAIKLGGHEAVTLWLALKAYASSHPTDGFVPSDEIEDACERLGIRKPERTLEALLGCGALRPDGTRSAGLVEPHDHGCLLHDYLDHAMSSDELEERQLKDRERKQLQRDRARLRKQLMLSGVSSAEAERRVRDMSRDEVTAALADEPCESRAGHTGQSRDSHGTTSRAPAPTGASADADAPADARAFPSPTQPSLGSGGSARVVTQADIPCPPDLELSPDEFGQLSQGVGMTREFVDRATPQLRASFLSGEPRTLSKWRRTLVTALTTSWGNPARKDELLGKAPPKRGSKGGPVQPNHGGGVDLVALTGAEVLR